MYVNNSSVIMVVSTNDKFIHKVRYADFEPLHPALDSDTIFRKHLQPADTPYLQTPTITTANAPLSSFTAAQHYPDSSEWYSSQNKELQQRDDQNSIQWLSPDSIPKYFRRLGLTVSYKYKRASDGTLIEFKSLCSIREDRMQPIIHFDPNNTAAGSAEKAAFRLLYATVAEFQRPMRHFDTKPGFTS